MAMRNPDNQGGPRAADVDGESRPQQAARPALPMTIHGPDEEVANEIAALSPDGAPAHPHDGPGRLVGMVVLIVLAFGLTAIGLGVWLGWVAGVAVFGIGVAAIFFNPAVMATLMRTKERKTVADMHDDSDGSKVRPKVVHESDMGPRPV